MRCFTLMLKSLDFLVSVFFVGCCFCKAQPTVCVQVGNSHVFEKEKDVTFQYFYTFKS